MDNLGTVFGNDFKDKLNEKLKEHVLVVKASRANCGIEVHNASYFEVKLVAKMLIANVLNLFDASDRNDIIVNAIALCNDEKIGTLHNGK